MTSNHIHAKGLEHGPVMGGEAEFEFSFAFQPIVNASTREVISFEALVRGPCGEPSKEVFAKVDHEKLYQFDEACRTKAIALASQLKLQLGLNLNMFPSALYRAGMDIRATLQASLEFGLPAEQIVIEVTEAEKMMTYPQVMETLKAHREFGFRTAIDDFGCGYSGLSLLVEYQPNYIKLDRSLIADIQHDKVKQAIFHGVRLTCKELGVEIMAEGVETGGEYRWLHEAGIDLFQGYYFARPTFEALAEVPQNLYRI